VAPSGGATAVQEIAANSGADSTETPPKEAPKTPAGEDSAGAKKLNYPFTLLEIRENAEISAVSAAPTKA
jgi:hypothetical protein